MIKLYQFPISHFCEKIRWALDFKGIEYRKINLIPGLHIKKMKRLCGKSSVPVLDDNGQVVAGSMHIIDYLDEHFPEKLLTPEESDLKSEALEWESFAEQNVGVQVRQICYHTLLNQPDLVRQFFTHEGPWYGSLFLKMAYPKISQKMRYFMNINQPAVDTAKQQLSTALNKINERISKKTFLVGDRFSRADLSVAALFAPLFTPAKYGLNWPENHPPELNDYVESIREQLQWVESIYNDYR